MVDPKVIIVGAGPSGVRCAETLIAAGIQPVIIDESRRDGGQIYRRQPDNFSRPYSAMYGTEAKKAEELHKTFDALKPHLDYRPETMVWNIANQQLFTACNGKADRLDFDALILCTGATDRIMPVKGWNRAGVYTMGASQIALKYQACGIGQKIVLMGTGPLLYLVAYQYMKAGANVAKVLDTSAFFHRVWATPQMLARAGAYINGVKLTLALMKAGVSIETGIKPVEIEGSDEDGVSAITYRNWRGKQQRLDCDAVALGYHLRAETQLADLAGCAFEFRKKNRLWLVKSDAHGRTSVDRIYVAGDGSAILGADSAEISGKLAALAALQDLGHTTDTDQMADLVNQKATTQRFADGLSAAFPWPEKLASTLPEDAIVCRCEGVTAGEIRRTATEWGESEINRGKAISRVGMGRCQGRYCSIAAAEIMADAAKVPVQTIGRQRSQAPVKPLLIATHDEN